MLTCCSKTHRNLQYYVKNFPSAVYSQHEPVHRKDDPELKGDLCCVAVLLLPVLAEWSCSFEAFVVHKKTRNAIEAVWRNFLTVTAHSQTMGAGRWARCRPFLAQCRKEEAITKQSLSSLNGSHLCGSVFERLRAPSEVRTHTHTHTHAHRAQFVCGSLKNWEAQTGSSKKHTTASAKERNSSVHMSQYVTNFPSVYFPSVPWCVRTGQAYNQLAALSSCGCQLDQSLIGDITALLA